MERSAETRDVAVLDVDYARSGVRLTARPGLRELLAAGGAARPRVRAGRVSSSLRDPTEEVKSMVRFLAVYDKPDDREAFDRHYREVHIPLAKQLPGLRCYTISRNPAPTRDREAYYLIAELDWDDMTDLRRAFETPEGRATADDVAKLAPKDKVRTMVYELEDALL